MSTLTLSMPWIVAFIATFALASVGAGGAYWLARRPSQAVHVMKRAFSALALCVSLSLLVVAFASHSTGAALLFVLLIGAGSGLQALIERALPGETISLKTHFSRSFYSYLCTACFLFLLGGVLAVTQRDFLWDSLARAIGAAIVIPGWVTQISRGPYCWFTGARGIPVWAVCLSTGLYGLLAGWLFAPLSISFYRLLFQNMNLRPGIDRPLTEKELAGNISKPRT